MHSSRRRGIRGLRLGWAAAVLIGSASIAASAAPVEWPPLQGLVENLGQLDPTVRYYAVGARTTVFFTVDGIVLELRAPAGAAERVAAEEASPARRRERHETEAVRRHALRVRFRGANPRAAISGEGQLAGRYRFFLGDEPSRWRSDVRSFASVRYHEVQPGVDVVFHVAAEALTYEILAQRGADPAPLGFDYEGATTVRTTPTLDSIETSVATVRVARASDGTGSISVGDSPERAGSKPALAAAAPDRLRFSTFLGGARDEAVYALVLDGAGRPIVVGATRSIDFPASPGALDPIYGGSDDAFVMRLAADGSGVEWSTFLGGAQDDRAWAVALDAGRPVIAGVTASPGFPVTPGAADESYNGAYDAFVTVLAADGSAVLWSTFLGGSDSEWDLSGLVLDAGGRPTIAGSTRSADFPSTAGAYDATLGGTRDAFVARLAADGASLDFATLFGGAGEDAAEDLALDGSGRAVVVGRTYSADFPATPGALQGDFTGPSDLPDGFVARISSSGDALEAATFLGGDLDDEIFALVIDAAGQPVVTGSTGSPNFPTTAGAFQRSFAGNGDAFVARLGADLTGLVASTLLGGAGGERGLDLALDASDRPTLVGWTCSEDFPVAGPPYDDTFRGPCDAYVSRLTSDGTTLVYGTFVGGWYDETAYALALDDLGRPVVAGQTLSSDFPSTPTAYDPTHNSPDTWYDGFVLQLLLPTVCTSVGGAGATELRMAKATRGSCPSGIPQGNVVDLIEGRLERVGPADLGAVEPLACASTEVVFDVDTAPTPGRVLFQLARVSSGGSYADGGGAGLVGPRIAASGDCP